MWECCICKERFDSYYQAEQHEKSRICRTDDPPTCEYCTHYIDSQYDKYDEWYSCSICGKDGANVSAYKDIPQPCYERQNDDWHYGENLGKLEKVEEG